MTQQKTILISGASGTVGRSLIPYLHDKGYKIHALSRKNVEIKHAKVFIWDVEKKFVDIKCLEQVSIIIHLAGEGIADKNWSDERKKQIIDSRVNGAELLLQIVKQNNIKLEKFISASAVGYFGADADDKIYTEEDKPATDFLGECCIKWEAAADNFKEICEVIKIRLGIVLDKNTGALPKLMLPIKFGFASALGAGTQSMAWIHIDDVVEIFYNALTNAEMSGAYIASSPQHQTNKSFTSVVAKAITRPYFLPNVPGFLLKMVFGEMSIVLLKGQHVYPKKLLDQGYTFKYEALEDAVINLTR